MDNQSLIDSMLNANSYCVIGASRDPSKFGTQVFRTLKSEGKTVYPVNPNTDFIGKSVCYHSVADVPSPVEVAVFVVPPEVTEEILPECQAIGIKNIWMQPGADSASAIKFCEDNGLNLVSGGPCFMVLLSAADDDLM